VLEVGSQYGTLYIQHYFCNFFIIVKRKKPNNVHTVPAPLKICNNTASKSTQLTEKKSTVTIPDYLNAENLEDS
jgi:hypothetical protein